MQARLEAASTEYDLLVVGGGINGAGVARDAALRGYRVGLVERSDFGSGTSSRTSKLVHGGIRYLEHGALRLVWEASQERRRLLRLAPHLVHPLPFVFPVYRDSRFGPGRLRAGMWLYDLLAAFRNVHPHRMLSAKDAATWREGLRPEGLQGAALYWDAAMDDARLVLANVLAAREAGATALARIEATAFVHAPEGRVHGLELLDRTTGARARWTARLVVACTGPWTNAFLGALPGSPRPVAPTRGTHIVFRKLVNRGFTLAAGRDGRVFFVLPWLGATLVGTTDLDDGGDPGQVAPTEEEIAYLLAETQHAFPAAGVERTDVVAAFAGLRPLLRAEGGASGRSREHAILEPVPGLLAVVGGKFTTYRAVAEEVVDSIAQRLGARGPCRTRDLPLPGGDLPWSARVQWEQGAAFRDGAAALAQRSGVDPALAAHWLRVYGSRAEDVGAIVTREPALAAALCPHHPHCRAEVLYAVQAESALELEDWFLRRTHTGYSSCNGRDAVEAVGSIFARALGWNATGEKEAVAACHATLDAVSAAAPDRVRSV